MRIANLQLANRVILAPMAGITDLPYRRIMKSYGAALVFSEMVSANGLIRNGRRTFDLVRSTTEEKPLAVQLFGDDPQVLAAGAGRLQDAGELFDVNCGCPVNKVIRSGAGSALLRDPRRIGLIVAALRKVLGKPLTIKIRSGWDRDGLNYLETGRIAEAEGADAITLHPRTRSQGFGGKADWEQIAKLKAALKIPVIGSGDILTAEDAVRMLETTGCDAVMIGRGSYGNPWLIRNAIRRLDGKTEEQPTTAERLAVALRHIDDHESCYGMKKTLFDMRKHLCWYSRGLPGAAHFRLAVNRAGSVAELRRITREFFLSPACQEERHG